jgi:phosphatidylserine/phosphatidylglycerophosphate/cardiolipin synthase-like enzyme
MSALDADSADELSDAKSAELSGTRFDLGARTGTRNEIEEGIATFAFQNGICVVVGQMVAFAMPTAVVGAWSESDAQAATFGHPTSDPIDIDGTRAAQEFEHLTYLFGGTASYSLPRLVWEASLAGQGMIGAPLGPPQPVGNRIGRFTPHDRGVVLEVQGAPPQPLSQAVFDLWKAQADAGGTLGPPIGFAFPSSTLAGGTVYQFAAGTISLDASGVAFLGLPVTADLQRYFLPEDVTQHLLPHQLGVKATPFVGGDAALAAMQADIASARGEDDFIYLLNWYCDVDLELIPGSATTTLRAMLSAAAANVQIRAMFWAGAGPPVTAPGTKPVILTYEAILNHFKAIVTNRSVNTRAAQCIWGLPGDAAAILDDRHTALGVHHQKVLVLGVGGNLIAYVGGLDFSPNRLFNIPSNPGTPLFDISVRLEGAGAWPALDTFVRRWQAHPAQSGAPLRGASVPIPPPAGGSLAVQVTHTYGKGYPYPAPVQTARTARASAINNTRQLFYMEDQYCVGTPLMGATISAVLSGNQSVTGVIVIAPDAIDDMPDLPYRRRAFLAPIVAAFPGRFLIFERLGGGSPTGPTAYVHSKLLIVDDQAAFIGSVNSNRRSWSHDSEVDATIVDMSGPGGIVPGTRGWIREFRCTVWSRHFNQPASSLGDPSADLAIWQGINSGTVSGSSVRPYDVNANVPRWTPYGVPIPSSMLDKLWDTLFDPR